MKGDGIADLADKFFAGLADTSAVLAPVAQVGAAVKVGKFQNKQAAALRKQNNADMAKAIELGIKGSKMTGSGAAKPKTKKMSKISAKERKALIGGALLVGLDHMNTHVIPYIKNKSPGDVTKRVSGLRGGTIKALEKAYGSDAETYEKALKHYKAELSKLNKKRRDEAAKVGELLHHASAADRKKLARELGIAEEAMYVDENEVAKTKKRLKKLSKIAALAAAGAALALAYSQRDRLKGAVDSAYNALGPQLKARVSTQVGAMQNWLADKKADALANVEEKLHDMGHAVRARREKIQLVDQPMDTGDDS